MPLIPAIELNGFSIATDDTSGGVVVKLSGNGDSAAVQPLEGYLERLHSKLAAQEAAAVSVDLTQLYFMNSSCIKSLASWIHDVKTSPRPYSITMRLNTGLSWQKRTLKALARLAPSVVRVEDVTE